MSSDGRAENIVSDPELGARFELEGAVGHRDDDALDAALGVDEEIRERAYLLAVEADLLPLEIGEHAAPDGVEAEPAVEQDECGPDRDPLVADLARREGQKAVRTVTAPDVEPDQPRERTVEEPVDGNSERTAPTTTGRRTSAPVR